jgi:cytochrome c oxidase subunit III
MENRSFNIHPYRIMMTLFLAGLTMIFLGLSASYLYTRLNPVGGHSDPPVKIPHIFLFNTVVLLLSSWTLIQAKKSYLGDDTGKYQVWLSATLVLTGLFMGLQFLGWQHLLAENPNLATSNMRGYVYAISVIHFFHIIVGLPFLVAFVVVAFKRMKEPVSVFVYFSDETKLMKLKLLTLYWHFLDIMWLYLVVFFWANYFIQ